MKLKSTLAMFAGLAVALGITIAHPEASSAKTNTYYCAKLNGGWNTFVNTPRGRVTLINWVRTVSAQWTPESRCLAVSQRFQKFLDNGSLKYIRTGNVNRQPVLCVADQRGGTCPDKNVLITLQPGADPEEVLIQLIDFRRSVSGQTIVLSNDDAGFYQDGEFYVDMEKFLETVPVDK
jgi:hypothetical protein